MVRSAVAGGSRALRHRIAAQVHARTQHFFERNFLPLTQVGRQRYTIVPYTAERRVAAE